MKVTETACDLRDCKRRDGNEFHIFSQRKLDGAGSMEDWYYEFDLCPTHTAFVLEHLLAHLRTKDLTQAFVLQFLKDMGVKTRER